ncbi:MAG: hypothetical protein V4592_01640 [Bacteroidota bacterium]
MGQIIVDPNVIKTYNIVVQQLSPEYQQGLKQMANLPGNMGDFAIVTLYQTDTLNKQDLIPRNKYNVTVTDIKHSSGKKIKQSVIPKDENINMPMPCTVALKGDTLILDLPPVFAPYILHKIIHGRLISTYQEYQKRDTIFRLNQSQPKTERLSIPAQTPVFKLSTLSFKAGQFLYGEIEYITDPYYIDDPNFKLKYINKRMHCKYVFKATIVDLNNPMR